MTQLWKGETEKAVRNFPISGERVPGEVIHMLARLKAEAARVNAELGGLDQDRAARIAGAAEAVAAGQHDDQFPIDVFQTGSGTSTNMNVNEVVATLAGEDVHANDHVNMSQSSNDLFPSAVHIAVLDAAQNVLLPALDTLGRSLASKAEEFAHVVKPGRTHLMDAVPVSLGQEFGGYATQIREGAERVRGTLPRVGQLPLGGSAVGTGLNAHPEFATKVRERVAAATGLRLSPPAHPFEAQGARDALVELSGALKTVAVSCTKIANDVRWMGSGPRAGLGEINLPPMQAGSSIMPGKVNPVIPEVVNQIAFEVIGNDVTVSFAAEAGQLQLNAFEPIIAHSLFKSVTHLSKGCLTLAERCVKGITANRERLRASVENSIGVVTALNPYIGYANATEVAQQALMTGKSVYDLVLEKKLLSKERLDEILQPEVLTRPRPLLAARE